MIKSCCRYALPRPYWVCPVSEGVFFSLTLKSLTDPKIPSTRHRCTLKMFLRIGQFLTLFLRRIKPRRESRPLTFMYKRIHFSWEQFGYFDGSACDSCIEKLQLKTCKCFSIINSTIFKQLQGLSAVKATSVNIFQRIRSLVLPAFIKFKLVNLIPREEKVCIRTDPNMPSRNSIWSWVYTGDSYCKTREQQTLGGYDMLCYEIYVLFQLYSQLCFNGHLFKTDTFCGARLFFVILL